VSEVADEGGQGACPQEHKGKLFAIQLVKALPDCIEAFKDGRGQSLAAQIFCQFLHSCVPRGGGH
jgi:hypothetical protein